MGTAIVGTAIVGTAIVGTAIVGTALVGTGAPASEERVIAMEMVLFGVCSSRSPG